MFCKVIGLRLLTAYTSYKLKLNTISPPTLNDDSQQDTTTTENESEKLTPQVVDGRWWEGATDGTAKDEKEGRN